MNDHLVARADNEIPKRIQRTGGNRIDKNQALGSCDLDQAQARVIGIFAYKLGVKAELGAASQIVAAGDELLWSSDNLLGHARRFDQESHVSD